MELTHLRNFLLERPECSNSLDFEELSLDHRLWPSLPPPPLGCRQGKRSPRRGVPPHTRGADFSLPRRPPWHRADLPFFPIDFQLTSGFHFTLQCFCGLFKLFEHVLRHPTKPEGAQGHRARPLPAQSRGVLSLQLTILFLCKWHKLHCHDDKDTLWKLYFWK